MRKGQTAMEYLMTYGWAILIILVVGAVLYYYGVFTPGRLVGSSITGFTNVHVTRADLNAAGSLTLVIENRVGEEITMTKIYCPAGTGTYDINPDQTLAAGKRSTITTTAGSCAAAGATGDTYNLDPVSIEYSAASTGPTTYFNSTGTISGTRT